MTRNRPCSIRTNMCRLLLMMLLLLFEDVASFSIGRGNEPRFGSVALASSSESRSIAESSATSSLFFADEIKPESSSQKKKPNIQRSYRLFEWNHQNKTYKINYRVEEPPRPHGAFALNATTELPAPPQPVLLVHGFGANVNHFRHQYPALTQAGYRVYAIDLIGFGASEKATDVDYSIELFVQLLRDFIHAMNDRYYNQHSETWMVAGNSIGGLCCLGLAKELPDQVQGVVLFNCAGGMSGFRYSDVPFYVRPVLYLVQNLVLKGAWGKKFFDGFKTPANVESILRTQGVYRNQEHVNDELLELLLGPADDAGAETVFLKVFGGPPGPTPKSLLADVECPVLAIWGAADPWTPYDKGAHPATEMVKQHDDFQLHVLPDTGHCPHDENPTLVHDHMIPWMKQVPQRYHPTTGRRGILELSSDATSKTTTITTAVANPFSASPGRGFIELSSADDKENKNGKSSSL